MDLPAQLSTISKAIGGAVAGVIAAWLMKHNIVIADNLPDTIELLISGGLTALVVYLFPKNRV